MLVKLSALTFCIWCSQSHRGATRLLWLRKPWCRNTSDFSLLLILPPSKGQSKVFTPYTCLSNSSHTLSRTMWTQQWTTRQISVLIKLAIYCFDLFEIILFCYCYCSRMLIWWWVLSSWSCNSHQFCPRNMTIHHS